MEQIRCFVAIELPLEIKAELTRLEDSLKSAGIGSAKWVDPLGVHLTLKFLGNVASEKIPEVIETLDKAIQGVSPFSLEIGSLGGFPNRQSPQVIWVGVEGELAKLIELQRRVERELVPLGFPQESRSFTPHLTLARLKGKIPTGEKQQISRRPSSVGASLAERLSQNQRAGKPAPTFHVEAIHLIRSQLTPRGAIYTPLASLKLG
jgi:2'-5' RNA ligase